MGAAAGGVPPGRPAAPEAAGDGEVPWLTPPEMAAWMALIRVVSKLTPVLDRNLQRTAGISHFEYFVLIRLSESPGYRLRMSDLAKQADASNARLSHVAGRLESRGLIERQIRACDRRGIDAVLTDAGLALVVATAPGHVRHVRALVIDPLEPQELEQLRSIGEKLFQRLQEEDPAPGC